MTEDLENQVSAMAERSYRHGSDTAEITILSDTLPWTRDHFAELADRVADHWIDGLADHCKGDDEIINAICRIAASARLGFIERVAELMKSGVKEAAGGAQ